MLKFYNPKANNGIINLVFNLNEKKLHNGSGYFIVKSTNIAEAIISLEGKPFFDRSVNFEVEDFERFVVDPIRAEELGNLPAAPKIPMFFNSKLNNINSAPEVK